MNDDLVELARVTIEVDARCEAMWPFLSDFARPQLLAPTIDSCRATGKAAGATRVVESSRGLSIHERLLISDRERYCFSYEVTDDGDRPLRGVTRYIATVRLRPLSGGRAEVDWRTMGSVEGDLRAVAPFLEALYRRAIANLALLAGGKA